MSSGTDLPHLSATELVAAYGTRQLSPVEVTRAILDHILAENPKVNAFAFLAPADEVLETARQSERRWAQGTPLGPVDGVPAAIKDLLLTRGWPTLRGSLAVHAEQPWAEDAPAVARLREQGAILLGKTTTAEFGAKGATDTQRHGVTRNPWNTARTPGGSSGGSAAAAALGFGPIQIGTDGGGSIRQPASFTGLVGFKPSFGLVPGYPASFRGSLFHVGPLARSVADVALILNGIARPDHRDWLSQPHDGRDWRLGLEGGVTGLRIAFSPDLGYARVNAEVATIIAEATDVFRSLGATVEQASPGFTDPFDVYYGLSAAGAARLVDSFTPEDRDRIGPNLRAMADAGRKIDLGAYLGLQDERAALGRLLEGFHHDWDLLITPTTANSAPGVDETPGRGFFTYPFNLTKQPAISIPAGTTAAGLPVGLQIVGPRLHGDSLVLRAARAFERVHPFTLPKTAKGDRS
ncbi:amidase [Telmatospirillum siberiense]|uniref:Amidase n=1 Tax=Telmatospirillum siberiense TaxID=382514 RepID=A0A2N3PPM0_9PROT|nr:amidase [Telmatospirillum siberiense]PKU22345.1 amidase [Telmatospirillum siberiense]